MSQKHNAFRKCTFFLMVLLLVLVVMRETGWSDSLWNASSSQRGSLYSTTKSEYAIGDIITILIVEDISASTSASTDTDKESDLEVGFEGFDNYFGISHLFGRPISADPRFSVDAESEFDSSGDSERSSSVTGTVTGQVTEILSNGNLRIEASQTTVINGERNSIILLGTVRPQDISASNTIFSTQISNAELRYEGKGPLSNVQKRGILKEFLEYIWPF